MYTTPSTIYMVCESLSVPFSPGKLIVASIFMFSPVSVGAITISASASAVWDAVCPPCVLELVVVPLIVIVALFVVASCANAACTYPTLAAEGPSVPPPELPELPVVSDALEVGPSEAPLSDVLTGPHAAVNPKEAHTESTANVFHNFFM